MVILKFRRYLGNISKQHITVCGFTVRTEVFCLHGRNDREGLFCLWRVVCERKSHTVKGTQASACVRGVDVVVVVLCPVAGWMDSAVPTSTGGFYCFSLAARLLERRGLNE